MNNLFWFLELRTCWAQQSPQLIVSNLRYAYIAIIHLGEMPSAYSRTADPPLHCNCAALQLNVRCLGVLQELGLYRGVAEFLIQCTDRGLLIGTTYVKVFHLDLRYYSSK